MKNSIMITTILVVLFTAKANSQQQLSVGVNAGAGISTGYKAVLSPDLRYQVKLNNHFDILVTAGYIKFFPSFVPHERGFAQYELIPAKAGLKYFFNGSGAGVYGLAEAGAAFSTGINPTIMYDRPKTNAVVFVFSPAVGYAWRNRIDLALKYEGYAKDVELNYLGIRIAYGFKL